MKWISVNDQLPRNQQRLLLGFSDYPELIMVGFFVEGTFFFEGQVLKPTHWMPLPEPPQNDALTSVINYEKN